MHRRDVRVDGGDAAAGDIAQRWRLRLVPGQRLEIQPKITLRPKYGIRMVPELEGLALPPVR